MIRWQQGKGLWTEVKTLADFDREVMHADKLVVVGEWQGTGVCLLGGEGMLHCRGCCVQRKT